MESKRTAVEELLKKVRACRDCKIVPAYTPVVYGTPGSRILVVSEGPPKRAWEANLGESWSRRFDVSGPSGGAARGFCRWLGIEKGPYECLFWIQRRNCWADKELGNISQHCSSTYIPQAIRAVRPSVIVPLGRVAASWFPQLGKLSDAVGKRFTYEEGDFKYPLIPLFHPSGVNRSLKKQPPAMRDMIRELAGLPKM